jgi:hypothetical protein
MLYKIVPFLLWYHLRERAAPGSRLPKMAELAGDERLAAHWRWHTAAVAAALAACWRPACAAPAGVLLAAACARLGLDLARPALRYRALLRTQAS